MNLTTSKCTKALNRFALLGVLSLSIANISQAVLVSPNTSEVPGAPLGTGTSLADDFTLAGAALADKTLPFSEFMNNSFYGTIRSLVVQNVVGDLDFYFQLNNQTPPDDIFSDIFRVSFAGFTAGNGYEFSGSSFDISYRTDGLAGISGVTDGFQIGTRAPKSADRDSAISNAGGIGFDFADGPTTGERFLGNANNLHSFERSFFMVVRTGISDPIQFRNTGAYPDTSAISGAGTAYGGAFAPAPVPEPSALGLVALGALGLARRRRR